MAEPLEDIEEIERVWAAATPGPWEWSKRRITDWDAAAGESYERDFYEGLGVASSGSSAILSADSATGELLVGDTDELAIAKAPEHVAALLAEVKRLRAVVEGIRAWNEEPTTGDCWEDKTDWEALAKLLGSPP